MLTFYILFLFLSFLLLLLFCCFFDVDHFFKVFIEFVTILLLSVLCFGFLAVRHSPQPGIEPTLPALEGEVLTTGPPGKSLLFLLHLGYFVTVSVSFYELCFMGPAQVLNMMI